MPTITTTELGASGRYVDFGDPASLRDLTNQTILAYCRPTGAEGNLGYLLSKQVGSISWKPRLICATSPPRWVLGASSGGGLNPDAEASADSVVLNGWVHIAATWDGSLLASGMHFFIGQAGAEITEHTGRYATYDGSGSVESNAGGICTLLNRHSRGRAFVGDVAYIAYWNRILSLEELVTAQANGPLSVPTGLVLCWANQQDYGPNSLTPTGRSTFVGGALPPNTALGGGAAAALAGDAVVSVQATGALPTTHALAGDATVAVQAAAAFAEQTTVIITDLDAGNANPATSTVTDAGTATPIIEVQRRTGADGDGGWRHFLFAVEGVEGKLPVFRWAKAGHRFGGSFTSAWAPVYTTDWITWTKAPARTIGATWIEWSFSGPLPAGRVYVASHPLGQQAHAATFAADLLSTYPTVAAPTPSADTSGIYNTTPAETDDLSRAVGANAQYALQLAWGGPTTDGKPKRKLVVLAGMHAAGEAHSWIGFTSAVQWMLSDSSAEAAAFRANWDVWLYFNVTPNGLRGGNARWNFRSSQDPNRDWKLSGSSTLAEITALRSAIEADTGGAVNVLYSFHGAADKPSRFNVYLTDTDSNVDTRRPIMQSFLTSGASIFGVSAHIEGRVNNTETWWSDAKLGTVLSFPVEFQALGESSQAEAEFVGRAWMQTLQAVDAAGWFAGAALAAAPVVTVQAGGALTTATQLVSAAIIATTATGTLSTGVQLAGAAASAALAAGALTVQLRLRADALAAAIAAAGLTTALRLAASAQAGAQASGALTTAGDGAALAGNAAAAALATGSITIQIRVAGAALASAIAQGVLAGSAATLQADAIAAALATSDVATAVRLAASALASSASTGALTAPGAGGALQADAQAIVIAEGGLTTSIRVAGAAAVVSQATGTLDVGLTLRAGAFVAAASDGMLLAQIQLNAAALARALASGYLVGSIPPTVPASRTIPVAAESRMVPA